VSRKWKNRYQNEVDEEIKKVGSRDKVMPNERSDQLLLERMMKVAEQRWIKSEYFKNAKQ